MEGDKIDITGLNEFASGRQITVVLNHSDGTRETIAANQTFNAAQIAWFKAGSALNLIRKSNNS